MKKPMLLRLIALVLILIIVLVFLIWNAGLVSFSFLPSPGASSSEQTSPPDTDPGPESAPVTNPGETDWLTEPVTLPSTEPGTAPAETFAPIIIPSAADVLAAGGSHTSDVFDPSSMLVARIELMQTLRSLPPTFGSRAVSRLVRKETSQAGVTINVNTEFEPILSLTPYMGFIFAHTSATTYLLDSRGNVLNKNLPSVTPVYDRNEQGMPVVRWENAYYAISPDGSLIPTSYFAPPHGVLADIPAPAVDTTLTPFSVIMPVFRPIKPENLLPGIAYYTEKQKDAILGGMTPADAVIQFPISGGEPAEASELLAEEVSSFLTPNTTAPEGSTAPEITPPESDPAESETLPPDTEPLPSESDTLPPESETLPPESETLSPESETLPPESETLPPESETLPPESETLPPETEAEPFDPSDYDGVLYTLTYEHRWGYDNEFGITVIDPIYLYAFPFGANGLAAVTVYHETLQAEVLTFIDMEGRTVIDVAGKILYDYTVNDADLYDGYYLSLTNDDSALGSYYFDQGYVRLRRRLVLRNKPDHAYIDQDILISETGKLFAIPEGYSLISYSCGILLLEKDGLYGYMDVKGNWIAQPTFTGAQPFYGGLAVVEKNGLFGVVDNKGNLILPFEYTIISHTSGGVFTAYHPVQGWNVFCVMKTK